jgi:hypothetical protein
LQEVLKGQNRIIVSKPQVLRDYQMMEPDQFREFLPRVRKLISCPISWEQHFDDELLCKELRIYWTQVCREFEADGEMRFYRIFDIEEALDEHQLRIMEINVPVWRERAVDEYNKRVGFLTNLSHLDRFGYPKHFPSPALSKEKIIERTLGSDSLFFPEVTPQVFQWLFQCVLTQAWLEIVEKRPLHIFLTSEMIVGASDGALTNTIRFDMDYSTPTIHSHPRQLDDIPSEALHFYDEDYEAGCFDEDQCINEFNFPNIDDCGPE